mmetsp:Transcript_9619/g.28834  ORF Transcript_9619/g.28834 Transcript_9619/m.28834 type:complete len:93 (-) Transcript_9619:648-926(-)
MFRKSAIILVSVAAIAAKVAAVSATTAFAPPTQRVPVAEDAIQYIWGIAPNYDAFGPSAGYALASPPVLEIPNFLSDEECEFIKCEAARLQR